MPRKLDRLNPANSKGVAFQNLWQKNCTLIEGNFSDLTQLVADLADVVTDQAAQLALITAAQADAAAAAADAAAAAADALAAQSAADAAELLTKIGQSWTVPASVLSAADAGSNVTITVAAHTRMYGDGTQLSVNSHSFTGKNYSTDYGIYYDDATTSDTTPNYQITTVISRAQNNWTSGRHRVGTVITPAAAGAPTSGGTSPPGGGGDDRDRYSTL